ncbi:carboxypeptidase-like regulatory domain-containing protein [Flavobacterium undicola]|uniref:carboxypeptidase-like regulatory domain-containing protein n=1 Tax=Flavobacterium undicola TaxID=1932779 RepID=UPI0013778C6F|nr:carboxypeptidase-like regulatory domain-containing protein [Flavobacterium undicola]MBA0884530.1 carboxypeptidase-like regulatory domain-containing protein [Flavobacterium undicola]
MKTNNTFYLLLLLLCQIVFGQDYDRKEIYGIIRVDSTSVEGVNIVNETTQKATSSDKNGNFYLLLKEGDLLVFSAVNLVTLRKKIVPADLEKSNLVVQLHVESILLKEVIVKEESRISAESLGIISSGQKKYTVAERRLYTARSGLLDRPLNWMSGRTAMLKKELVVSEKEQLVTKLEYFFEEKYYVEKLKIPKEYIKDFQLYCIENKDFVAAVKAKNKTLSMFLIISLATDYNKIVVYEN